MKPILFNTEMVQAILDGRKKVTRRIMKPQPLFKTSRKYIFADETCPKKFEDCNNIFDVYQYKVGDILYVRETWCKIDDLPFDNYVYRTDYGTTEDDSFPPSMHKWKPSIHMPKEAARIFLKVTDVRVERLQDITEMQVRKEGFRDYLAADDTFYPCGYYFRQTWDSTIKKQDIDKYGWEANPWVWVIAFERVGKPDEN